MRYGGLDVRREVSTAHELILHTHPALQSKFLRPHGVQFPFQIECALFVCDVARCDEEGKAYPEHECVDGEEGAIVEEDSGPAYERSNDAQRGGNCGDDKLGLIGYSYNVSMCPDIEVSKDAEYE